MTDTGRPPRPAHLDALEAESIYILREVAAQSARTGVALLDRQGFLGAAASRAQGVLPGAAAVPVSCISIRRGNSCDTITFRDADRFPKRLGLDLRLHTNPDGLGQGINPFDHGCAAYYADHEDRCAEAGVDRRQIRQRRSGGARAGMKNDPARKSGFFRCEAQDIRGSQSAQRPELWESRIMVV